MEIRTQLSKSELILKFQKGEIWKMPYTMTEDFEKTIKIK